MIEQQREIMRYLRDMSGWLEREARTRQEQMRDVSARVEALQVGVEEGFGVNVGGRQVSMQIFFAWSLGGLMLKHTFNSMRQTQRDGGRRARR